MNMTYPKTEFILEEVRDKVTVGMHLLTIPTGVRDHDSGDTFDD